MKLLYFALGVALAVFTSLALAQQSGTRTCSTTTSGSISHEYCTFTPLVVQAPAVTVQPAAVTVSPQIIVPPAPKPAPKAEKPIKE